MFKPSTKMWNPSLYQKAIKFAGEAHANQLVPGTKANYLLHLSNVAMEILLSYHTDPCFDVDLAMQVALLHDTIEDTAINRSSLLTLFGTEITEGVEALTKDFQLPKEERMADSLKRINLKRKEIGMVKLADRITNLQVPPSHWPKDKIINYLAEAKIILSTLEGKNTHLESRLKERILDYQIYC